MLENYLDQMMQCTSCSFCTVTCPVMNVLLTDASSPRGRVQIAYGLYTGELELDESAAQRLYECTTCGMCDHTCPSGVHIVDVIKAARKVVYPEFSVEKQRTFADNITEKEHTYGELREPIWAFTGHAPKEKAEVAYFMGCKISAESGHEHHAGGGGHECAAEQGGGEAHGHHGRRRAEPRHPPDSRPL